jgi:diguanylate cyclase (GGDEF)-like protein
MPKDKPQRSELQVDPREQLDALRRHELLNTPPEPEFDRWIVALRRTTGADIAAFLLPNGGRLVVKSLATADGAAPTVGDISARGSVARHLRECAEGSRSSEPAVYAAEYIDVDGRHVGRVAIVGYAREEWSEGELLALKDAADAIATQIRLRLATRVTQRVRDLLASQNSVHELLAQGAPLQAVLDELVRGIQHNDGSVLPCVILLDRESSTLHPGSAELLPAEYVAAIDGAVIGPNIGTCGAAAWSGRLTITEDIGADPKWAPIRELPLSLGLRHCWSMPIKATDGGVLGTLAFYGPRPRKPSPEQLALMGDSARLAGIAIERHHTMQGLVHDARHDGLTGLANRSAIFEQLDEAIKRVGPRRRVAVLFVDLDGLKKINDTFGHDRADAMLREIGGRLAASVRPSDFVGRFGGDEFVVIAEGVRSEEEAAEIGERLLADVSKPLPVEGVVVTASIGIALLNGSATDAREALREADRAMYTAKSSGRDRLQFFEGKQPVRTGARLTLARELKNAETRGEMHLGFQPVFELPNLNVVAVEALLRWDNPRLGEVSPAEFMPVAEDTGAIVQLGAWVLRESCETIARVIEEIGRPLELGVSVSARQVARAGFAQSVRQILTHAEFQANRLALEITETAPLGPDAVMLRTLTTLTDAGVRIVLDDFGTGYSSLEWLKRHPLHAIKIDRSFIGGLPDDEADKAVVAGVIGIAKALGCTVIAEGVETNEQLSALRGLGCERVQGALLAEPLSPSQLIALLVDRHRPPEPPRLSTPTPTADSTAAPRTRVA